MHVPLAFSHADHRDNSVSLSSYRDEYQSLELVTTSSTNCGGEGHLYLLSVIDLYDIVTYTLSDSFLVLCLWNETTDIDVPSQRIMAGGRDALQSRETR